MSNEVRPIDHSTGSAIATTAGGTVWGGFKWGLLLTAAWVLGITALVAWGGFALGGMAATALGLTVTTGTGAAAVTTLSTLGGWMAGTLGVVGGLFGFGIGSSTATGAAIVGTAGGAIGGGIGASNRVAREREAAQQLQQEVAMAQAGRGQYMIDAGSAEYQGRMAQLERSRAQ